MILCNLTPEVRGAGKMQRVEDTNKGDNNSGGMVLVGIRLIDILDYEYFLNFNLAQTTWRHP